MGYRLRLGRIAKIEREKYRGKTSEEVEQMIEEDLSPYRLPEHEELYEIGKYVYFPDGQEEFYDFNIREEYESDFQIMSKEGLKKIIEWYQSEVLDRYKELMELSEKDDQDSKDEVMGFFYRKIQDWDGKYDVHPYWLDQDKDHSDGAVVRSWSMEYAIFNLVHIYRYFDWENDYLIYSGW